MRHLLITACAGLVLLAAPVAAEQISRTHGGDTYLAGETVTETLSATGDVFAAGSVVNVACGQRCGLLKLLLLIEGILDLDVPPVFMEPRQGDVKHSLASIDVAEKLLGYQPQVGLEDGLRSTIEWYVENINEQQGKSHSEIPIASGHR